MFEYKLLSERDAKFSGTFDLTNLETAINGLAAEGWRLSQAFVAANVAKSGKAEIVVILERPAAAMTS